MPQDGLFFRVLRRFNILWVAVLGLLLIVATGYRLATGPQLSHFLKFETAVTPPPAIGTDAVLSVEPGTYASSDTQDGPYDTQVFLLNHVGPMPDFNSPEAFKHYEPAYVANVMVFNNKTSEGVWLFPTSKQVIASRDAVYEGAAKAPIEAEDDPRPVIGMVMLVKDKPAKLGAVAKDGATLYVWTKGTTAAVKLLAADGFDTYGQVGADRYSVVYSKGAETRVATYSVPEFKLLTDKLVPAAPK